MDILDDLLNKSTPIPSISTIDSRTFKKNYLKPNKPILIKGMANEWKAKKDWSIDFFLKLKANKAVPLEVGNVFQGETQFLNKDFTTYLKALKDSESQEAQDKTYLSMYDILKEFPDLKNDPDFSVFTEHTKRNHVYAWIGPKGTVSGFHWDHVNNMLAQLKGKKLVLLISPKYQKEMYVSDKFDLGTTFSAVDINDFDEHKFSKFKDINVQSYVMEPGDVLFIPVRWWHYVKSLDVSISVNNFGFTQRDMWTTYVRERIQASLHHRGFYKTENCTCHKMVDGKWVSKSMS